MEYRKPLIYCVLLFTALLCAHASFSQCASKLDFKVESKEKGSSTISLRSSSGSVLAKVQLYDLNAGKVVVEKEVNLTSDFTITFTEVKSSTYTFYAWAQNCKKPLAIIGEKHGILIEN